MTTRRNRTAALGARLSMLAVCLLGLAASPAADDPVEEPGAQAEPQAEAQIEAEAQVEQARTALESWVQNRRLIAAEKREWALGRELLQDRIEIVQAEIEALRERITEAEADIAKADDKRTELVARNEELKQGSSGLAGIVTALETRTLALLERVPETLVERVQPLSQRVPTKPDETRLSLSERFANVVGVLNAVNKFNREVTVTSEVRALPDGTTAEVAAVYFGIAQAYYVSANGASGGLGTGSEQGWVWTPSDEHAADILEVISILENETPPAFVPLPLEVR